MNILKKWLIESCGKEVRKSFDKEMEKTEKIRDEYFTYEYKIFEYIKSDEFLDEIVKRINKKQLKK